MPREDGKTIGETCAIFYKPAKFELLKNGDFWLSETPERPSKGWNGANVRICSWGKFKHIQSQKTFYFFNVHIDLWDPAKENGVKLLAKKIREISNGEPFICTGDFNDPKNSPNLKAIFDISNSALDVSKAPLYGPNTTCHGFRNLKIMIDYVFVSKNIDVLKVGILSDAACGEEIPLEKNNISRQATNLSFPSDHYPVAADIILK